MAPTAHHRPLFPSDPEMSEKVCRPLLRPRKGGPKRGPTGGPTGDRPGGPSPRAVIARAMTITEGAVEKYPACPFAELGPLPDETGHRRVRVVLTWL